MEFYMGAKDRRKAYLDFNSYTSDCEYGHFNAAKLNSVIPIDYWHPTISFYRISSLDCQLHIELYNLSYCLRDMFPFYSRVGFNYFPVISLFISELIIIMGHILYPG